TIILSFFVRWRYSMIEAVLAAMLEWDNVTPKGLEVVPDV
ncbi:unnamed protein product, partial [marine sediment metagenome]